MKQFYCAGESEQAPQAEYEPRFYFEARVDFIDLRTGFHHTTSVSETVRLLPPEGEMLWTPDMLEPVDPERVQPEAPPDVRLRPLPPFVSDEALRFYERYVIQYLMRTAGIRLLRNRELNLCSTQGEHPDDFHRRCLERFKDPFRREMDLLHEVAHRRLEQLKNKYLDDTVPDEFDMSGIALKNRNRWRLAADRITKIYLRTDVLADAPALQAQDAEPPRNEIKERLWEVEEEVCRQVRGLLRRFRESAAAVDDYFVRASHKDIHLVRTGILWLPGNRR